MKSRHSILLAAFLLIGCASPLKDRSELRSAIKVGMTYEEVEAILGKPQELSRGATELKLKEGLSLDELRTVRSALLSADSRRMMGPSEIETVGQLIYVGWGYPETEIDTVSFLHPYSVELPPNKTRTVYFVNDEEVSREEYQLVGDTVWFSRLFQHIVSRDEWHTNQRLFGNLNSKPVEAKKRSKVVPIGTPRTEWRTKSEDKQVRMKLYIIFDASSGRVVASGFRPIAIAPLP